MDTVKKDNMVMDKVSAKDYLNWSRVNHLLDPGEPLAQLIANDFFSGHPEIDTEADVDRFFVERARKIFARRANGRLGTEVTVQLPSNIQPEIVGRLLARLLACYPEQMPALGVFHDGRHENGGEAKCHLHLFALDYPNGDVDGRASAFHRGKFFIYQLKSAMRRLWTEVK